jgi:hypothetical protein
MANAQSNGIVHSAAGLQNRQKRRGRKRRVSGLKVIGSCFTRPIIYGFSKIRETKSAVNILLDSGTGLRGNAVVSHKNLNLAALLP